MANTQSNPRRTLITLFALSIVLSIGYTLWSKFSSPTPVDINVIAPGGAVTLSIRPDTNRIRPQVSKQYEIWAESGNEKITALQIHVTYDPLNLEVTEFRNSESFPHFLQQYSISSGKMTAVLGVAPESGGVTGPVRIATFQVKALKPGSYTLAHGDDALAAIISSDNNALGAVANATIKALYPGDINDDKAVNLLDFNAFLKDFGKSGSPGFSLTDLKLDGKIDVLDFNALIQNFGKSY